MNKAKKLNVIKINNEKRKKQYKTQGIIVDTKIIKTANHV